ncbi:RagB/SusD family nutrient uptake outer membrane protein [Echinicola rosea]|uniref:RagB/SusD family nutrient uptake outer membrane protein n=1 Tax=Echinicola rosea TaxID=1807691 RepID=A0ABQ1V7W5_9BACT|nr:RagB/SusD family nutrient uptake outer membrane protein [Echinicola rosea]GGF42567.1 hypothetical protein GCM10011339_33800 [Echinicola rosea]
MKNHYKYPIFIMIISIVHLLSSCEEFLDAKPDKALVVPSTLDDLQGVMDAMNRNTNSVPHIGLVSSDDMLLSPSVLDNLSEQQQAAYTWEKEIFTPAQPYSSDWATPYQQVFLANVVLDGLKDHVPMDTDEELRARHIKGRALFMRGHAYTQLMEIFTRPYEPGGHDPLGLPLKGSSDVNKLPRRSTVPELVDRILADLREASSLLPDKAEYSTRGSKWAAESLLARFSLVLGDYEKAYGHAGNAMAIGDGLIDFSGLDPSAPYPIGELNPETIYYATLPSGRYTTSNMTYVAPELYALYGEGDFRKSVFFEPGEEDGFYSFKGSFTGGYLFFGGISTGELVLTFAEGAARTGRLEEAQDALNIFLEHRMAPGSYVPVNIADEDGLLEIILEERRKELLFRNIRWMDLRRLNREEKWSVTLTRTVNGEEIVLPPGDSRYTFPLPPEETELNGLEQNPR